MSALDTVRRYHEETKHRPDRYARSLGYLDWDTQPDPFRAYEGAARVLLDEPAPSAEPTWDALFSGLSESPLDRRTLSQFFYDALALSAWKEAGTSRWPLRVNPSSGNLHPTEGWFLGGAVEGLTEAPVLAHYSPRHHAFEVRARIGEAWEAIRKTLPEQAFLVGLTSIHWRESWKYGERAFRYCQHDVGHAIGALALSAAVLGWEARLLEGVRDEDLGRLFGVSVQSGEEREHPDTLIAVFPRGSAFAETEWRLPEAALEAMSRIEFAGTPNVLSAEHQPWPIIDEVAEATVREVVPTLAPVSRSPEIPACPERELSARKLIRQRRSAVAMDGSTSLSRDAFFRMLARTMPAGPVFSALPWQPAVHLGVFVHRVDGLSPGLYLLVREPSEEAALRARLRPDHTWIPVESAPPGLPLFRLAEADARSAAKFVSCQQDIAADGAFSLGMLASFAPTLEAHGAWFYKRLFWECGAIGQVLYVEAEAAGVRATGIGCFFDDLMHEVLGFADDRFQSLYHFTVGGPLEDRRLRTLPPYEGRG